jgi:hypothetical protein
MTVLTTTLPAVNPIRLGSQPIRRRALVPQVEPPVEEGGPNDEQEDQTEQPETDVVAAADAAPPAAPTEPVRRGRGRPRKNVVDVIAQGSTKTPAPAIAAALRPMKDDLAAVGTAAIMASQEGLTLKGYIDRARGIVAAYDRCVVSKDGV